MEIVRTYKFRLMPTPEQAERLNSWCAGIRWVYNAALEQRLMYGRINYTRKRGGTALRDHSKERDYTQRRGGQIDTRRADLLQNSTIQKRISDGKIDPMTLGGVVGTVGPDPFDSDVRFSAIGQTYQVALKQWKNDPDLEWLADAPAISNGFALRDLHQAFENFKAGRTRFPSWRNAVDNNSFTVRAFVVAPTRRVGA
ncbi:MAG: helix-turn-helix domain-containing protein [Alphaproteobacteria bacterium]